MSNPKISVIVPVYNAERYIKQCLDSVLAQDFADFEIIIVDDGSTDSSFSVSKEYAEKDERIKLFYKENSGPSATRNFALRKADGEYIIFLDSDDYWLDNTVLGYLYKTAQKYDLDILRGELKQVDLGGEDIGSISYTDMRNPVMCKVLSSGEFFKDVMLGQCFLPVSLFRKSAIGGTELNESLFFGEDIDFYARVLLNNLRCMYVPICFYAYRVNPTSITNSGSVKNLQSSFIIGEKFAEYESQTKDKILEREYALNSVMMYYWTLASLADQPHFQNRKNIIKTCDVGKCYRRTVIRMFKKGIINRYFMFIVLPPSLSIIILRLKFLAACWIKHR